MSFTLEPLPYAYDALEPYMSSQTLQLHHGKHHQTYVTNLNNLIAETSFQDKTLEQIVMQSFGHPEYQGVFNNSGQHWNHILFWSSMQSNRGKALPESLERHIIRDFGSVDTFKEAFISAGLTQFGSGWCWLVVHQGTLEVIKTPNAENPLVSGKVALLGCDVWEHSYYLDYQNRRADYLKAFINYLVDWEVVAVRLENWEVVAVRLEKFGYT